MNKRQRTGLWAMLFTILSALAIVMTLIADPTIIKGAWKPLSIANYFVFIVAGFMFVSDKK